MFDIAIVGGGLCGLALAHRLSKEKRHFALYEARPEPGGRIKTVRCAENGIAGDLGATWIWPETQPNLMRLITALGLPHFPQYDSGKFLTLSDPEKTPAENVSPDLHGGAIRLQDGMGSLTHALLTTIPPAAVKCGHELSSVEDAGDHVILGFRRGSTVMIVRARRVVLAIPPRLLTQIQFLPGLPQELADALQQTPTWMAAAAKAVQTYAASHWQTRGFSGSAFVTHEQAVLREVFDASSPHAGALGGFLALSPEQRESFADGMPMLIANQIGQLFGADLEHGPQYYQDWAKESFTCSALDRQEPAEHPPVSPAILRDPQWNGRLYFGSAESASHGTGYLEGAVGAAQRIGRDLAFSEALQAQQNAGVSAAGARGAANAIALTAFRAWAGGQAGAAFLKYREQLNRRLARQEREQLSQRALLSAIEETFHAGLDLLEQLDFDGRALPVEKGRSALTPEIQHALQDFLPVLIDKVQTFNATSCALSAFPFEQTIDAAYKTVILRDIAAAWREFLLLANRILLTKHSAPAEVLAS